MAGVDRTSELKQLSYYISLSSHGQNMFVSPECFDILASEIDTHIQFHYNLNKHDI